MNTSRAFNKEGFLDRLEMTMKSQPALGFLILVTTLFSPTLTAQNVLTVDIDSYRVEGQSPINAAQVNELLKPYTGKVTLEQIQAAVKALANKLHQGGHGFYQVELAPQKLDKKQVTLNVQPLLLEKINIKQQEKQKEYFSEENIRRSVSTLVPGETPQLHEVTQQLKIGNLNPAKNASIRFAVGDKPGTIDADINVQAERPWNVFSWFNNTGSEDTGDYRLGIGVQHHNLFDLDHDMSVSFATSPDHFNEVKQYGISYRVPIYEYNSVWQWYAHKSDVDSGVVAGGFNVAGKGRFMGTIYEWHLPRLEGKNTYGHHLDFGIDDKLFENDVLFAGEQLGVDVRSRPFSLAYKGTIEELSYILDFYFRYEHNIESGSHNDDRTYHFSRTNASPDWDKFSAGVTFNWQKHGYRVFANLDGQYSNQELISGEQFGVGGLTGKVKGFRERELAGDKGIKGTLEVWSPAFFDNQVNLLAFTDVGYVERVNPLPDEFESDTIWSAGIGAAYRWKEYVDLTMYLAHVLDGNDSPTAEDPTESGDWKVQFHLYMIY